MNFGLSPLHGVLEQDIKSFGLRLVVKSLKQKGKYRFDIYALINIFVISLIFFFKSFI